MGVPVTEVEPVATALAGDLGSDGLQMSGDQQIGPLGTTQHNGFGR